MGLKHRYSYESLTAELKASERYYLSPHYAGNISVALVYPNLYGLGMSNLGFMTVHRLAGSVHGIGLERFFPALEAESPLNSPFYSFETGRPLGDFDVLMFSFSYEGDFDKIPGIFAALGIPVMAAERNRHHPVFIAGGAAVASNAPALSLIFDALIPGEAETTLVPVLTRFLEEGLSAMSLASIPGVWVPAAGLPMSPVMLMHDVNKQPAYSHIVSTKNAFGGAHIIEVMRGCPRVCAFCLAREIYAPVRPVDISVISNWLDQHPDCRDLGLVAPSLFDHPQIEEIFAMLSDRQIRIRNSSVKWEKLNPVILNLLRKSGVSGLTLAPETGSVRLRKAMGKPMDEERFISRTVELFAHGFEHLKMYFVACLPGETEDDLDATIELISHACRRAPTSASISAAFSVFVPKRHTPWHDQPAPPATEIKRKIKYLKERLNKLPGQIKVTFESPQEAVRQAYLSQVGPELAEEYAREAKACRENRLFSRNQFSALEF